MAIIQPFRAFRYNPKRVNISFVTAPPYDVISPLDQDELYARDERNVVRLDLGKDLPLDDPIHNRYTRAREFLENWIREKVLIQDEVPSIYLYEQEFTHPDTGKKLKRFAFISCLALEEFGKGYVVPHEHTLAGPKLDRLKLLAAARTAFSCVFGLYEDPKKAVQKLLRSLKGIHPLYSFQDDQGVRHHVWRVSDEKKIRQLERLFKNKSVYIADGHHRYETAYEYFRSLNNSSVSRKEKERAGFTLAALVALEDPGLAIFPTHRLVRNLADFREEEILEAVSSFFHVKELAIRELERTLLKSKSTVPILGLYLGSKARLLTLKNPRLLARHMPKGKSKEWQYLSTSIASEIILRPVFRVTHENKEAHLAYTHFFDEAVRAVDHGEAQCAILLQATPLSVIKKICKLKQRMPQKSTYFYPKLASGIVFYRHE